MRVVRWRKADTGVESFTITATGIYFPVGKVDSAFIARYAMTSAGQTATIERVVSADGTRVGTPGITVSGTTEVVSNDRRGLSTGIIVTSISGTLIPVLDNLSPITTWPDGSLGRFTAMEDLVAYVYGSTPPVGLKAVVNGTSEVAWNGSAWEDVGGGVEPNPAIAPVVSLNRLIRMASSGDSTADFGGPRGTSGVSDVEYCTTVAGVQSNGNITAKGFPLLGKRRILLVSNGGRIGETTTQILARSSLAYSASRKSIEDVKAKKPDVIALHGGSINDITTFDAGTPDSAFLAVADRHIEIAKSYLSSGIAVIDTGLYGYDGNAIEATKLAAIRRGIVLINTRIATEAARWGAWKFVSPEGIVSTSGAYIPGMTDDGTHLTPAGANAIGNAMALALDLLYVCVGTDADDVASVVYSGATWAAGSAPTDAPYVGPTNITLGAQACTPALWTIPFDVTSATNELLILWTAVKAIPGVLAGANLHLSMVATIKKDGIPFNAGIATRCWIYDTVSHLNAYQHVYTSELKIEQQFFATVAQTSMGANTRIGVALNNLPIGTGYSIELTPMKIFSRPKKSPLLL